MSINQRIKEVRKTLGLSQVKFAEGISVSNGYIAAIELGKREVNERIIMLICSAYGVSKHWLKQGEGEMLQQAPKAKIEKMVSCFSELNTEFQDYVLQQLEQLILLQNSKKI